jgi:hypothetical protein
MASYNESWMSEALLTDSGDGDEAPSYPNLLVQQVVGLDH